MLAYLRWKKKECDIRQVNPFTLNGLRELHELDDGKKMNQLQYSINFLS